MKCKRIIKVVSALALTLALLVSTGVVSFAATSYTTTTNYLNQGTIEVTSVASGLSKGDMATYVAYNGDDFSEANAVYIDQATANGIDDVVFTYQADSDDVKATVKFGGADTSAIKELGYTIAVTVNGGEAKEVVVPTVDAKYTYEGEEDILVREIPVDLVAGEAVDVVEFTKEGDTEPTTVDAWYVKNGAIVVLSNVIRDNGTLAIKTKVAEVSVTLGDVTADTGKITAFAKAVCADNADYGIIIAQENADISISTAVGYAEAGNYSTAVKLPALGKGAEGGFCVEVEDDQFVKGTNYKVVAYAVDKVTSPKTVEAK